MYRLTFVVYVCAQLVVLVNSAVAVDRTWVTGGGLNWNDANNWDPNDDFPDLADNAFFNADETYLTIVQSPSNVANVFFTDGNVSIAGGTLNVGNITNIDDADAVGPGDAASVTVDGSIVDSGGDAVVGDAGFGTLTIETSGSFAARNLFIGNDAGSTGEVNVDNATLTTDGPNSGNGYRIGQQGTGTLNVTGGGLVQIANDTSGGIADFDLGVVAGASGTLNISGAGSSVIAEDALIGNGGVGTVMVSAGGLFDQSIFTSPDAFVGLQSGAAGNVTVTGDNSRWNMRNLQLGDAGSGTLDVLAGGAVDASGLLTIGDVDGGSGIVTVNGSGASDSRLDVGDILTVGNGGQGTLNIEAGADVDVGVELNVGNNASSALDNVVTLTGAGSSLAVAGETNIGLAGRGIFNISAGATFNGTANVFLGEIDDAVGLITVDGAGSQLTTAANLFVGNEGFGTMNVTTGGFVQAAGAFIGDSDGDSDANGEGILLVNGSDGSSPSTLNITGATFAVGGSSNENGGLGTLNLSGGGLVNANGIKIGSGNGGAGDGTGTVNVTGAGSLLDADANGTGLFLVGDTGAGTLNVTAGGRVEAAAARIGNEAGSETATATIDGAGSQMDVSAAINIGQDRPGTLSITNGGVLVSAKNNTSTSTIGIGSNADGASVTVSGAGSLWNNQGTAGASTRLRIGQAAGADLDGQRARLEVAGGGKVMAHDLLVADGSTSGAGEVVIEGQDGANNPSTISANGFVVIGDDSVGRLTVTGGGRFELTGTGLFDIGGTTNGEGFATVTGAGSIIDVGGSFRVGRSSSGNLTIVDGGTVSNAGDGIVARDNSAGPSTVTVGSTTADESTWNNAGSLYLGGDEFGSGGTATVQINPGGTISAADVVKIWSGTTTLAGGTLSMETLEIVQLGELQFNTGTIRFTGDKSLDAGALADVFGSEVGATLHADQRLEIVGAATLSSPLRLNHATAALSVGSVADLANLDWDAGALSVTAQEVAVESAGLFDNVLIVGEDQALHVPNNSLTVGPSASSNVIRGLLSTGSAVNNGLTILAEADGVDFDADNDGIGFTNNSDLVVVDTTVAGNVTNNGRIEMLGNVTFLDDLALQPGGSVDFDLGGTAAGQFDALTILGDFTLDGLLSVTLDSGFSLTVGDSFDIIDTGGAVSGTFTGLADGALVGSFGGVDLFIDYTSNVVSLVTAPGADVDLDNDGDVDGRDFLSIQQTDPSLTPAWESAYGDGGGAASLRAAAIPETTTLGLFAAGCFLAVLRGSTRR